MCKIHLPRCGDRQNRSLNRQNRVKTAAALRKSPLLRARWLAESAVGCLSRIRRRRGRRPTTLPTFTPTKDLIPSLAILDFSHHETNPIQVLWHTGRPSSQARRTPRRHNSRARFCHLPVTTHSLLLSLRSHCSRAFVVLRVGSKSSYNALCCGGGRSLDRSRRGER